MKMALAPALIALGCIGLWANFQAVAQGASQREAASPAAAPSGSTTPQDSADGNGRTPNGTASPEAAADAEADVGSLLDNGLWPDASALPCCAACGGGDSTSRLVHDSRRPCHQPQCYQKE